MTADRVLILGAGFIGRALAQRLAADERTVTLISRSAPISHLNGVDWQQGRLDDRNLLRELLPHSCAVVHAATTSTPGRYPHQPAREAEENLLPLLHLLEILGQYPGIPLLYLSSGGALYGNPTSLPVTERQPPAPLSYHAAGKAASEHFLGVFARQGHTVTVLRPANAYGPGQPLKAGFGVIRTLLEHTKCGSLMDIWGDGETVRDYLYIDDLIRACMHALAAPTSGTFNVGSGTGINLNDLCQLAECITGRPLQVRHHPARGVDVKAVVLDSAALRLHYGWQPMVTLEQGMRTTWEWLQALP
ncbi:MAG: NAD-dependent epimerase/dehydratase family protein [Gallionellaceae bacterium]|nr:NAD-dependent epimerase/dehydratase family protein [Gallionellaceae bacterium]